MSAWAPQTIYQWKKLQWTDFLLLLLIYARTSIHIYAQVSLQQLNFMGARYVFLGQKVSVFGAFSLYLIKHLIPEAKTMIFCV